MNRNIHEGRMLLGLLVLVGLIVFGTTIYFHWWLPLAVVAFYAVAYGIGAILIRVFDL